MSSQVQDTRCVKYYTTTCVTSLSGYRYGELTLSTMEGSRWYDTSWEGVDSVFHIPVTYHTYNTILWLSTHDSQVSFEVNLVIGSFFIRSVVYTYTSYLTTTTEYVCVLLPLKKSLDFISVWSILFRLNVLKEGWDSVTQNWVPTILCEGGMYVGCMYVVCNHTPGPSVLGTPDPRCSEDFFLSTTNILISSPPTPLTVCRTVS